MTELTRHGTGWVETEVLMDVVEIYNSWDGSDPVDFTPVQRRLRESFTDSELVTLETVVTALHKFIAADLSRRVTEKGNNAQEFGR